MRLVFICMICAINLYAFSSYKDTQYEALDYKLCNTLDTNERLELSPRDLEDEALERHLRLWNSFHSQDYTDEGKSQPHKKYQYMYDYADSISKPRIFNERKPKLFPQ